MVHEAAGEREKAAASYRQAIAVRLGHAGAQDNLTRLQAKHGWTDADNPVSIITATIGRPQLARAIKSVSAQRYRNIQHLIVADGPGAAAEVRGIVAAAAPSIPTHVMVTPWQTGIDSFQGHRIFAACLHIVEGRFVAFLDDDNWLDADHISSLVDCAIAGGLEWAHSLRRIVDSAGNFLTNDDCQSLGAWESIEAAHGTDRHHHVDANCYLIRRDIAVAHSAVWHRRSQDDLKSPDYLLCRTLMGESRRFACTGKYSLNYALGGRSISVQAKFFEDGNAVMRARYPQGFPWVRPPAGAG
jgi:glycosyltransferase involved in cell wall biosynthesis